MAVTSTKLASVAALVVLSTLLLVGSADAQTVDVTCVNLIRECGSCGRLGGQCCGQRTEEVIKTINNPICFLKNCVGGTFEDDSLSCLRKNFFADCSETIREALMTKSNAIDAISKHAPEVQHLFRWRLEKGLQLRGEFLIHGCEEHSVDWD